MDVAKRLFTGGAKGVVVKAQIHAGGRGKGGGVKVAKTLAEAEEYTKKILGMQLVTHQTGPEGQKVQRVLIEEMSPIARELYLGIVLDRAAAKLVFMASQAGGMEIEEVAAKDPDAIYKAYIDPAVGFQPYQARKLAFALGLKPTQINDAVKFMTGLYKVFLETDASLLEINPFITTTDDRLAGARLQDQLRRQRHLPPQGTEGTSRHGGRRSVGSGSLEVRAELHQARRQHRLHGQRRRPGDGDHGHHSVRRRLAGQLSRRGRRRQPAADRARLRDPALRPERAGACSSTSSAAFCASTPWPRAWWKRPKRPTCRFPSILRLEGTNVEQGREILKNSGLNFIIGETMQDAAAKAVKAAKENASTK